MVTPSHGHNLTTKKMKSHKDLTVYKTSIDLVVAVYNLTKNFPAEERFGLTSQLRRAAVLFHQILQKALPEIVKRNLLDFYIFH